MLKSRVEVTNRLGLHARAAAQLVRLATGFESSIKLISENDSVIADAKSILSVLTLAASQGTFLSLEVEGEDEQGAAKAIEDLFAGGFGEL